MLRVKKIIDYNLVLFPFLWVFTLFLSLVEVFTYSGFFFFGFGLFLALTIAGGWLVRLTSLKRDKITYKLILVFNRPAFLLFSFLVVFFSFLEITHFRNYVYSTYHIQPQNLFWPWFLSGFLIFLDLDFLVPPDLRQPSSKIIVKKTLLLGLISLVLAISLFEISGGIMKNLSFIVKHPFASYDDKMRVLTDQQFYDFSLFIKQNTPEDARILIPPQGFPWPRTGHSAYLRYFLYPRYFVNGKEYEPGINLYEEVDYILLAWGETATTQYGFTHGWPKFDILAKRIIYKKSNLDKEIIFGNYYYQDPKNEEAWGIIELEKM